MIKNSPLEDMRYNIKRVKGEAREAELTRWSETTYSSKWQSRVRPSRKYRQQNQPAVDTSTRTH